MKAFFIMCVLVCFGCSGAPDTNTETPVYGSVKPDTNSGAGMPNEIYFNACAAGWQYVTVWVDGQPQAQWQPVICNQFKNPDTGDPMIFKGDPDPDQKLLHFKEFNEPSQKTQH